MIESERIERLHLKCLELGLDPSKDELLYLIEQSHRATTFRNIFIEIRKSLLEMTDTVDMTTPGDRARFFRCFEELMSLFGPGNLIEGTD